MTMVFNTLLIAAALSFIFSSLLFSSLSDKPMSGGLLFKRAEYNRNEGSPNNHKAEV
jgi:hypothetical protein